MAQDSVGAIPFFPSVDNNRSSAASSARDQATGSLFSSALTRASDDPSGSATTGSAGAGNSQLSMSRHMDKPKQGNHEPFFPRKAMPYHPDTGETRNEMNSLALGTQAANLQRPTQVPSPDDIQGIHDEIGDADEGFAPVEGLRGSYGSRQSGGALLPDDQQGLMNESYDGMAVSYPVSRIASESLDDETKASLKAQGLWDQPTTVAAQPSAKLARMLGSTSQLAAQQGAMQGQSEAAGVQVAKPITRFMASLENELGVSPDRLVQAFQQLPQGQLQRPPEETMIQVVKNLGLDKMDEAKALNLYSKMLAQMQMLDGTERMQNAALIGGGLTAGKIERQIEGSGLASGVKPEAKNVAGKYAMQDASVSDAVNVKAALKAGQIMGMEMDSQNDSANPITSQYGMKHVDLKAGALSSMTTQNANGQNPQQDFSQQFGGGMQSQTQAQMAAQNLSAAKGQSKVDLKHDLASANVNADSGKDAVQVNIQGSQQEGLKALHVGAPGSSALGMTAAGEMKLDANARHEAIQSIVNNAQALAHKGGGEMKLTLRPDQLGEIQLKVAMDGSKVNVQMTTERGEVKKLIEQGVHELRHGLAQHNLSMEKLDVSIANKDAGQFGRGQPDFNQAREFAQNQFGQQRERREMLDGLSAMREMAPRGVKAQEASRAASLFASSRGSGRINLRA